MLAGLSNIEIVLIALSALMFGGGSSFIIWIFASRIVKSIRDQKVQRLRAGIRICLNRIVSNTFAEDGASSAPKDFMVLELRKTIGKSALARQVLIDQILEFKKNLTGTAADSLVELYHQLKLSKVSIRKLNSFEWHEQAQGIRELGEMMHTAAVKPIERFLQSSNSVLREEALLATVRLNVADPLAFLGQYNSNISLWMRINLHRFLQQNHSRKLPSFGKWFHHRNRGVVLFAISMIRNFRQIESAPELVKLLKHPDPRVAGLAVETLGSLEAFETADELAALAPHYFDNAKLSSRIARALGCIGDPAIHSATARKYLTHPIYEVRFEAALALVKLGSISSIGEYERAKVAGILRHLNEPLLQ